MRLLDSPLVRHAQGEASTIRLDDLLAAVGGRLIGSGDRAVSVSGASVDSRHVTPGSLFVALHGERVDGHAFVADAATNGATVALVERPVTLPNGSDVALV